MRALWIIIVVLGILPQSLGIVPEIISVERELIRRNCDAVLMPVDRATQYFAFWRLHENVPIEASVKRDAFLSKFVLNTANGRPNRLGRGVFPVGYVDASYQISFFFGKNCISNHFFWYFNVPARSWGDCVATMSVLANFLNVLCGDDIFTQFYKFQIDDDLQRSRSTNICDQQIKRSLRNTFVEYQSLRHDDFFYTEPRSLFFFHFTQLAMENPSGPGGEGGGYEADEYDELFTKSALSPVAVCLLAIGFKLISYGVDASSEGHAKAFASLGWGMLFVWGGVALFIVKVFGINSLP